MYFITISLLLVNILAAYIAERKRSSMMLLYMGIWLIVVFLCGLHLDDALPFDVGMYTIVLIGTIAFGFGYLSFRMTRIGNNQSMYLINRKQKYVLNVKFLKVLLYFILVFEVIQASKVLLLMINGIGWTSIRYNYYVTGKIMSSMENQILTWLVLPVMHFVAVPIILVEKKEKNIISLVALDAFCLIFTSQAKEIFIYWILAIIIFYLRSEIKLSHKVKKRIAGVMIFFIIIMFVIQYARTGKISFGFLSEYLGIQLNLMNHWFDYIDLHDLHGYGGAFFNGLLNVICSAFNFLGIETPNRIEEIYRDLTYMMSSGVQTSEGKAASTNIYITQYTFFYYDFREWGIVLENFVFGAIVGSVSKWSSHQIRSAWNDAVYIIVGIGTVCSIIYWLPEMTAYILAFVYLRLCYRKS